MTSSNGNIFRATGHLCGEFTGPGEFLAQRPLTQSFDVFFDLCPNKRLSKQSSGWWFEMPSRPLWRHHNLFGTFQILDLSFEKGAPKAAPRKVIIVNLSIACVLDVFTLCQKYCSICFVHYHYSDISWSPIHYGDVNRPSRRLELPINRVLFNSVFRLTTKWHQRSALLLLCEGNSPVAGGFPAQRYSYAESVSIWWRHYAAKTHWRGKHSLCSGVFMTIIGYSRLILLTWIKHSWFKCFNAQSFHCSCAGLLYVVYMYV